MVNNLLFLGVCVCYRYLWHANCIVLYVYEGKVLMDLRIKL